MASWEEIKEVVMIPLSEVGSIRWTEQRSQKLRSLRGDMPLVSLSQKLKEHGVDISRQYLNKMETELEVKGATPELIVGLCKVFGCSLAELLCLKSTKIMQLRVDKS
ncbi:XRE family transcriptional regulator [Nostoc sp. 'Peltigera malacea cyanobiont' DB3992]|uniref:XRE family transcriptional regulator n=1 Tax=Nostoc sp. 'Peltigera malacea cyanobiont' DB3992 TaxID=1206980 RepID=UPI00211F2DCD|nr:XRE family transcriptional regulator [Nostoc sp. 'Peltigera malacea cyanobiont' DB3992]